MDFALTLLRDLLVLEGYVEGYQDHFHKVGNACVRLVNIGVGEKAYEINVEKLIPKYLYMKILRDVFRLSEPFKQTGL